MIRRKILPALMLAFLFAVSANAKADVTISYGVVEGGTIYIDLLEETANQTVALFGTGLANDGGADGFELDIQIGDGGSALGGSDTSPIVSVIDLLTGTIWENAGGSQLDVVDTPLARQSTVDTTSLVTADGLLAIITFDTTGFGTGEIDFALTGVGGAFDTVFFNGATSLTTIAPNGVIRVVSAVPEPGSALVVVGGLVGMAFRRRRSS